MSEKAAHDYSLKAPEGGRYQVEVSPTTKYGWFEHNELGDESGGGLWFDTTESGQLNLIDYDGVFELPKDVIEALVRLGCQVGEDFR